MLSVAGFVLIYIGAANVWFARYVETCTMGDADSLAGGVITLVAYLAGVSCLWVSRPPRTSYLVLLPTLGSVWMQTNFAARLAVGVWIEGNSACEVMEGAPYELDGRESLFAVVWLLLSLIAVAGAVALLFRELAVKRTAAPRAG